MKQASTGGQASSDEVVGMCFVVAYGGKDSVGEDMRVRLELRSDLHAARDALVNATGVDAACDVFREWLTACTTYIAR